MTSRQWGRGSKDRWYFVVGKSHTHTVAYLVIFFYSILDLPVFKYRHIIFSTFYSSGLLDFACGRWPLKFIFFLHPEDARLSSTQWDMTSKNHTSCVLVRIPDSQSTWLLSYMDMVIYIFFRWKKKKKKERTQDSEVLCDSPKVTYPQAHVSESHALDQKFSTCGLWCLWKSNDPFTGAVYWISCILDIYIIIHN